jgi:hypothetical protein
MDERTFNAIFIDVIDFIDAKITDTKSAKRFHEMLTRSKDNIWSQYDGVKNLIKTHYMDDKDGLLDRHKCAACFIVACLNGLKINEGKEQNNLNREKLALFFGLTVLRTFIIFGNKNHEDAGIVSFMKQSGDKLIYPERIKDFNLYRHNWTLELFYARENNSLFVLSLSHELFYIERYNRERWEVQRLTNTVTEQSQEIERLTAENKDLTHKLATVRTKPFQS